MVWVVQAFKAKEEAGRRADSRLQQLEAQVDHHTHSLTASNAPLCLYIYVIHIWWRDPLPCVWGWQVSSTEALVGEFRGRLADKDRAAAELQQRFEGHVAQRDAEVTHTAIGVGKCVQGF
jgi:hypothetical protein